MSIFHLDGNHKHQENSRRGVYRAKLLGYTEIDLDMMPDKFGNIYGCHWPEPMVHDGFRDTGRSMPASTRLDEMTPQQISRLRAGWGIPYPILRIERLMATCAKVHIGARLEPKHPIFLEDKSWQRLAAAAHDLNCVVRMYALPELDGVPDFGDRCVAAAKRAGIPGKVIR